MAYLVFAAVMAAVLIAFVSFRNRPNNDPTRSVDSFQRAIQALDPAGTPKRRNLRRRRSEDGVTKPGGR